VRPHFAYFKIGAFLTLEISLAALIIGVIISLVQARKRIS
jgi:flagellar biosynthesis protein FliQ